MARISRRNKTCLPNPNSSMTHLPNSPEKSTRSISACQIIASGLQCRFYKKKQGGICPILAPNFTRIRPNWKCEITLKYQKGKSSMHDTVWWPAILKMAIALASMVWPEPFCFLSSTYLYALILMGNWTTAKWSVVLILHRIVRS